VDFEAAMEGLHHLSGLRTLVAGHSLQRAGS